MQRTCAHCGAVLKDDVGGLCPNCIACMAFQQDDVHVLDSRGRGKGVVHVLGDYELLEEIARGGMGVVYKARQRRLERTVAVKMILAGRFAGTSDLRRFQAEAIAAANLKHPNIVAVHEVGECEGHHYFSMDYVSGRNLAELVGDNPLPAKQAARYVRLIAGAVQYAHDQGIVHRDLKPSNILVGVDDEPKITDFGLAKRWDSGSDLTMSGQVLGSPNFFPPEQAGGKSKSVGGEGDIYSLGAILYFLLTGRPPFLAESLERTLEHVLHTDAAPPSVINPAVPKDLETICLKCLEKDPAGRYSSARALADDLEHFERDEPIQARPISKLERLGRWCGRNRPLAGALGAAAAIFLAGFLGVAWQWRRAEVHVRAETKQRQHLESVLADKEIQEAQRFFDAGDSASALARLARILRNDPGNHIAATRLLSELTYRNFALPAAVLEHEASVLTAQFSADGARIVTGAADGCARIWLAAERLFDLRGHTGRVRHAVFSPDGSRVITASEDNTARIWDAHTGHELTPPLRHEARIRRVHFSPDGRRIATASGDATARIWDSQNGQPVTPPLRHSKYVNEAVFSPDGKLVLTASEDGTACLWNAQDGKQLVTMRHEADVIIARFSSDGKRILTASVKGTARVWNALTGEPITPVFGHDTHINFAAFNPDGTKVATASYDDTAKIWSADSGKLETAPLVFDANVLRVDFSPDGRNVFAISDTAGRLWDVETGAPATEPILHEAPFEHIGSFSPDGRRVIMTSILKVAVLWDVRSSAAQPNRLSDPLADYGLALSLDGRYLAAGIAASSDVVVWDINTRQQIAGPFRHPDRVNWFEFSPNGENLVTAGLDGIVRIWNVRSGDLALARPYPDAVHTARFSPDGQRIVIACADKTARIWEVSSGRELIPPLRHEDKVGRAVFSPDGRRVATLADKAARVWDALSGEAITPSLRHELTVSIACFSPDGRLLLTAGDDATARLWDSTTGKPHCPPLAHRGPVRLADFSADGKGVVTASTDKTVRVWDPQTGNPITEPLKHDGAVQVAHFSTDGKRLVTLSEEPATRIWEVGSGHLLFGPFRHLGVLGHAPDARFTVEGNKVGTVTADGVRLWATPVLPMPAPEWLPDLAEAVAGKQFDSKGSSVPIGARRLVQLGERLGTGSSTDFYLKWAQWFFEDREKRAPSPF